MQKMKNSSKSVLIFGIYALLMGLVLLLIPNRALPLLGIEKPTDHWIHLLGFVLCCSSYYYIRAALSGNIEFIKLTVHTRFAAPVVVAGLILSDSADLSILSFGIIDGLGGLWTVIALRQDLKLLNG